MKKILTVLIIVILVISPLSARTSKPYEEKNYVGVAVGYNGVRDSLISILVKTISVIASAGLAADSTEIISDNALALGIDGYFEITPGFSISSTAGCSVDWSSDGGIVPAPFGDVIFYGRLNGGEKGDFLLGSGIGTFAPIKATGIRGYISLLGAMRYQLDIAQDLGWWMDMTVGWNAFQYDDNGIRFISDGFYVTPSLRTGISYSF